MNEKRMKLIVFLHLLILYVNSAKLDIGGSSWIVENRQTGHNISAIVPGGIYTDLMRANIIDDVFYGFNDMKTRWVSKMDWNYSTEFFVSEDVMSHKTIQLVFEGIDTFSTILLNDHELGSTENMFVRYFYDIKPYLKKGVNHLQVRFKSAVNEAKLLFEEHSKNYSVVPLCVPSEYNGECHVNHIRKTQASFSWDWGPAIPSMGIYKNVYIEPYNSARIRDVTIKIENNTINFWDIEVLVYLGTSQEMVEGDVTVIIHTDSGEYRMLSTNLLVDKNVNGDYIVNLAGQLHKSLVKLWWPNGYGDQPLYGVNVHYNNVPNTEQSQKMFKIGFRTIELCQDEVDSGNLFYFKVNNVPIYAKGSNSIPINILPELAQNEATIKFLLNSAKDVNMNMVRVWGGGNYEADIFYELADEYGILVWQDFMFACNMYPATEKFLRNVRAEVRHQVRRLQHHTSIIVWAGNNENEAALRQNWYGTGDNFEQFKIDYKKLYVETIKNELLISDDTRPYLASSPSNGIKSIEEDYVAMQPQSNYYGDIHFYNYFNDGWNTDTYPIPRFSSEYGYQSLPCVNTLLTATNNTDDLCTTCEFLQKRQHLPDGFMKMDTLLDYQFNLPDKDCKDCYKEYIYKSQIIQAMAVKIETEFNRQWRSIFNDEGLGHTMGALYWQLNDVWVAPSWSGIDYKGNWKMIQYFSKNFFAPIIITGDKTTKGLNIYIVSDLTHTVLDTNVQMLVYKWNSFDPVHTLSIQQNIEAGSSKLLWNFDIAKFLFSLPDSPCGDNVLQNCFLYFTISKEEKMIAPDNFVFPSRLKLAHIMEAKTRIRSIKEQHSPSIYFTIEIEVDNVALFVWLDAGNITGRFSDNGFLQVTETRMVDFTPNEPVSYSEFQNSLTVTDLSSFKRI